MKNNIDTQKLYNQLEIEASSLIYSNKVTEASLLKIINSLMLNQTFEIIHKNNYNLEHISNLFRFYEHELKSSFLEDKKEFNIKFKCYILLVRIFTELCSLFSTCIKKRSYINNFMQLLKESNNMLKFSVPLEKNEILILNNLIGEQLYLFSHIQYINTKNKQVKYIFEEYYLNLENIIHGYDLSLSTKFANSPYIDEQAEYMIFLNNATFLLLKMIFKLKYHLPNTKHFEHKEFLQIIELFHKISIIDKDKILPTVCTFQKLLLDNFLRSSEYLDISKGYNLIDKKIGLLKLNTDEYKHLIDIIIDLKN